MTRLRLRAILSHLLGNYSKRWVEASVYDRAFASSLGERLRALDPGTKRGIEALLHLASAASQEALSNASGPARVVGAVLADAGPELSGRLLAPGGGSGRSIESLLATLLDLDPAARASLLRWFESLRTDDRSWVAARLAGSSASELERLARLPNDERRAALELADGDRPGRRAHDRLATELQGLGDAVAEWRAKRRRHR